MKSYHYLDYYDLKADVYLDEYKNWMYRTFKRELLETDLTEDEISILLDEYITCNTDFHNKGEPVIERE